MGAILWVRVGARRWRVPRAPPESCARISLRRNLAGGGALDASGPSEGEVEALRASSPWVFDAIMCLAGMYLAMLVTNWCDPKAANSPAGNPELSEASMWVRIGTQFAIHVIFLWSIVAPLCFPNRDFGSSSNSTRRRATEAI